MKKNQKHIFLLVFLLIASQLKSQNAISGIQGIKYYNIAPDTLLNDNLNTTPDEFYLIDLNQDGLNDLQITSHLQYGGAYYERYVKVHSLNSFTEVSYGHTDSTYVNVNSSWINRDILNIYNNLDTIDNNSTYKTQGYIGFKWTEFGTTAHSNDWENIGDRFIGVKYTDSNGIAYGWIKVEVTSPNECWIKEYSLFNTSFLKINNINTFVISVFPNPVKNKIFINSNNLNINKITLFNLKGELVLQQKNINFLDVSFIHNGLYLIEITIGNDVIRKKISIEK